MSGVRVRTAHEGRWTWMEEYVLFSATYYLSCPPDRTLEFGSGVFSNGSPMGTRGEFSGDRKITVYGAGAIHVRVADGKGDCPVGISQDSFRLLSVYAEGFALTAAIVEGDAEARRLNKP